MHAGELRINNWLTDANGKNYRITSGQNIDDIDKAGAIRLTPELLEKCSFTMDFNRASRSFGTQNLFGLDIYPDGSTKIYIHNSDQEPLTLPNNVVYLHQLQNLFYALCGEELQVEL